MWTAGYGVDTAPPVADHMITAVLYANQKQVAVAVVGGVPVSCRAARPEDFVDVDQFTGFDATQNRFDADLAPQDLPVFRVGRIVAWDIQVEEGP
jgi:hypothetical protein